MARDGILRLFVKSKWSSLKRLVEISAALVIAAILVTVLLVYGLRNYGPLMTVNYEYEKHPTRQGALRRTTVTASVEPLNVSLQE